MNPGNVLLRQLVQNPRDGRLQGWYVRWLTERGDGLADLYRLRQELAELPGADPRRPPLRDDERSLLKAHEDRWVDYHGMMMRWEDLLPHLPGRSHSHRRLRTSG